MKKFVLWVCLMFMAVAVQAQFEKGKWMVNPSLTGLGFSYDTGKDKASFGFEAKGGAFAADNIAILAGVGAQWNGGGADVYKMSVGGRDYFERVGSYLGANMNMNHWDEENENLTRFGFGVEAGYAFFLSRTVTIEPALYMDVNKDRFDFGLKIGFGFYF